MDRWLDAWLDGWMDLWEDRWKLTRREASNSRNARPMILSGRRFFSFL